METGTQLLILAVLIAYIVRTVRGGDQIVKRVSESGVNQKFTSFEIFVILMIREIFRIGRRELRVV